MISPDLLYVISFFNISFFSQMAAVTAKISKFKVYSHGILSLAFFTALSGNKSKKFIDYCTQRNLTDEFINQLVANLLFISWPIQSKKVYIKKGYC